MRESFRIKFFLCLNFPYISLHFVAVCSFACLVRVQEIHGVENVFLLRFALGI